MATEPTFSNVQTEKVPNADSSIRFIWSENYDSTQYTLLKKTITLTDANISDTNQTNQIITISNEPVDQTGNDYYYNHLLQNLIVGGPAGSGYIGAISSRYLRLSDNKKIIKTSGSVTFSPGSIPPPPDFFTLGQEQVGSLYVSLKNPDSERTTALNSIYDGYSPITHVYVYIQNGRDITVHSFENDAENSIYTRNLEITGLINRIYEVSISIENYLGESAHSMSKTWNVTIPVPDAPTNVTAVPTMFVDPFFNFLNVSMTVMWNFPINLGDPSLNQFEIIRIDASGASTTVHTINAYDSSGIQVTKYVDENGLVAGRRYSYKIKSLSSATNTEVLANVSSASNAVYAINKPGVPTIMRSIPNGYGRITLDVTNSNLNGLDLFGGFVYDYEISGNDIPNAINGVAPLLTGVNTTRSLLHINDLTNGQNYNISLNIKARIFYNNRTFSFSSGFSNDVTATPYGPLARPTDFIVSNVDPSGVPLGDKLKLTWVDPSNTQYGNNDTDFLINIQRKIFSAPDASYVFLADVGKGLGVYDDNAVYAGTRYSYKLRQKVINSDDGLIYSEGVVNSSTPFFAPSQPTGLLFSEGTMNYSFNEVQNSGGLTIAGYQLILTNVSNGQNNDIQYIDLGPSDLSGNLSHKVSPGRKYSLEAKAYVMNDMTRVYSIASIATTAYTKPDALTVAPTVSNVDASNVPLNTKLKISWHIPQDYDATNMKFALYRNGSANHIVDDLLEQEFLNINLINGQTYYYTVELKLGGLKSDKSPASYPQKKPYALLSNVSNISYTFTTASEINLAWTAPSVNGTGLVNNEIVYKVVEVDGSGVFIRDIDNNLTTTSITISDFTAGNVRYFHVLSGSKVNDIFAFNTSVLSNKISVVTYVQPSAPQKVVVQPSDRSCLIDLEDAARVDGLTFDSYQYEIKLTSNSSFNPPQPSSTTQSLFYILKINNEELSNGTSYDVRIYLKYKNALNIDVLSPGVTKTFTPSLSPNPVSGLSLTAGNASSLTLSWNYDGETTPSHYSVFNNGEILYSHESTASGNSSILRYDSNRWSVTHNDVVPGTVYEYQVVAETLLSSTYYVSSQAVSIKGAAYAPPTAVENLSYTPNNESVELTWSVPSNNGGAGVSVNENINSGLFYEIVVSNPDRPGYKYVDNVPSTSFILSGTVTTVLDTSTAQMTITNMKQYTVTIKAYFLVNSNPNNKSINKDGQTIVVQPRPQMVEPILVLTPTNTTGEGKSMELDLTIDPSTNLANCVFSITRVIKDPSTNTILAFINNQRFFPEFIGFKAELNDSASRSGLGLPDDTAHFLNGNVIQYTVTVTQSEWTVNKSQTKTSSEVSAVPSGMAFIEETTVDGSGNVKAIVNKNGANPLSAIFIGLGGVGLNTSVETKNYPITNDDFINGNVPVVNVVARDQRKVFELPADRWTNQVRKLLLLFNTANSSALKDAPAGSILGGN